MRVAKLLLLLIVALPLCAQILITPTQVSAQSGSELYCAARWLNPQVQLYCYTTNATPWDHLAYNSIFFVDLNTAIVPYFGQTCLPATAQTGACIPKNTVTFIFTRSGASVSWQMTINGSPIRTGVFQ